MSSAAARLAVNKLPKTLMILAVRSSRCRTFLRNKGVSCAALTVPAPSPLIDDPLQPTRFALPIWPRLRVRIPCHHPPPQTNNPPPIPNHYQPSDPPRTPPP